MILRPYQEVGAKFLTTRTKALLADEMRVGKTPQAIIAAAWVGAQRILVVCPAIAVPQWKQEFIRWWPEALDPPEVTVLSYDKARATVADLISKRWDLLIADECHYAKNPEAQRTKIIYGKDGLGWHSDRLWALSGTPAPKHAAELWPMLKAFGAIGMAYDEFVTRYCRVTRDRRIVGTREDMIPELRELLAKVMLRRKRSEVAPDMPEIGFDFLYVEPTYAPGPLLAPGDLRSLSGDELLAWLEQHAASEQQYRIAVANAKVPALAEHITLAIENELFEQTVVFAHHVEPLLLLTEKLHMRGISADVMNGRTSAGDRETIQRNFKAGKVQVVVANITAAGTAIDLSAARHAYFLELDWIPGANAQAANRLINMEKQDRVTVDVVSWPGSTDDRVQKVLLQRVRELSKLY